MALAGRAIDTSRSRLFVSVLIITHAPLNDGHAPVAIFFFLRPWNMRSMK